MKTFNNLKTNSTTSAKAETALESTSKMFRTTFEVAVNWLQNALILCNNIVEFDDSIYENARFDLFDEDDNPIEIMQYYITDCSETEVEFLEEHFGLLFTYSLVLDCYVLCVDHFGTSWNYVMIDTDLKLANCKQGTRRIDLFK